MQTYPCPIMLHAPCLLPHCECLLITISISKCALICYFYALPISRHRGTASAISITQHDWRRRQPAPGDCQKCLCPCLIHFPSHFFFVHFFFACIVKIPIPIPIGCMHKRWHSAFFSCLCPLRRTCKPLIFAD